jgi:carbonic anhydrase
MNRKRLVLILIVGLLLSACRANTPSAEQAAEPTGTEADQPPHWTYEGEEGPENWGELDPAFATCDSGAQQSPIDISVPETEDLANIVFAYQPGEATAVNNGHTVQVNYDTGNYIEVDGQRYDLIQHHFHAPSEHTVGGRPYEAEIHFVHRNAEGQLAVVGILLEEGTDNAAFGPLVDALPAEEGAEQALGAAINAADFLPVEQTTFRYSGSLTTPPCSEGVSWLVMTTPVQLAADQIASFETAFTGNNRPVQAQNDRLVTEDTTP